MTKTFANGLQKVINAFKNIYKLECIKSKINYARPINPYSFFFTEVNTTIENTQKQF